MIPIERALALAESIRSQLEPYCQRIDVAGSIRRRRPFVNDIDIVALPKPGQEQAFRDRCQAKCHVVKDGSQNMILRTGYIKAVGEAVQLDIFIAHPQLRTLFETRPTNYGSLLLCRTGSTQHNIYLVEFAKQLGLRWDPYEGVLDGDKVIASRDEQDIFNALGLPFIPPEKRER